MQEFDLIIIGGGPAGYTAAIRASQLGMNVACIEKRKTLGGTCLNVGCIPSKALLNFSEKFEDAKLHFADIGIKVDPKLDLEKMLHRKDQSVRELCKGIEGLFAKNKVTRFYGSGKFVDINTIEINDDNKDDNKVEQIRGTNILIATGSQVAEIPNIKIDEKYIVSSTGALSLTKVPENMVIVGGGYIGLELGSVWRRLGSTVTIIESFQRIVPALDHEISEQLHKILQKQGMNFKLNTKVLDAQKNKKDKIILRIQDSNAQESTIETDIVLMSIGRKPYTENLNLAKLDIQTDQQGYIAVNEYYQTTVPNIYAVGDVIKGPMLAHKAEEEAIAAIEIIAGQFGHVNYKAIPSVIYTSPEVACVGMNENELKAAGIDYKVGKFPFAANSRARAIGVSGGFVKILADSKTDKVLGAHIIGQDAGTLIAELVLGMEFHASSEDIARTCHAHPTLNEAVKEAALAVEKRAINF